MRAWCLVVLAFSLAMAVSRVDAQSPSTVLVVANANSAQSRGLARHYMTMRRIPLANLLLVQYDAADAQDTISQDRYLTDIATPIYGKIKTLAQIDYIVLCRNLPSKIVDGASVDSALAGGIDNGSRLNPYWNATARFTSAAYGMYLVTRLDGWSWADARALVNRSIAAGPGGTVFLDVDPSKSGGYARFNEVMQTTASSVTATSVSVVVNATSAFTNPAIALAGYASWGSNDSSFDSTVWRSLTFVPGAIAETAVSTSAAYLRTANAGGQSQIAQLIRNGVTGVKGYIVEPSLSAIANPSVLFNRYTNGHNLAESFYAASMYVCWKDVVIGDPLCSPYAR
jgi:uncharacterized protein (TIGR03790 family)